VVAAYIGVGGGIAHKPDTNVLAQIQEVGAWRQRQ
jgi:hypothetical protein